MTNTLSFRPDTTTTSGTGATIKPVWRVNQVLQARVVGQGADRLLTLRIGATEVSVRSNHPLTLGTHLTLRVASLQPEPVLQVIATDNKTPQTAGTDPAAAAMRQLLPRQTPLPPFFALLKAVNLPGSGSDLPAPLKDIVQTLLEQTPASKLTADGIKRAVSDSGLFLEAKLLRASASGGNLPELDLKRLLLSLLQRLQERPGTGAPQSQNPAPQTTRQYPDRRPSTQGPATRKAAPNPAEVRSSAPKDTFPGRLTSPQPQPREPLPDLLATETDVLTNKLRQQAEGALARLTLHQVNTAKNAGEGDLNWILEIPVLHKGQIDVVPLTIERRTHHRNSEGGPSWQVKLALDTPQFGPLYATIFWYREQVSSVFWAERDSTADLVRQHLDHLRNSLTGQGLDVTSLECHQGKPPDATQRSVPQSMVYGKA